MTVNKKMIDQLNAERTTPPEWTVTPYVIVPDEDEEELDLDITDEADAARDWYELTHDC